MMLDEIKVGMTLGEDVHDDQGRVLAVQGDQITEAVLNQLMKLNIPALTIDEELELLSVEERSLIISELSSFFRNFALLDTKIFEKIREETSDVISKIMLDDYALKCLNELKGIDAYTHKHALSVAMTSGFIAYLMEYNSEDIETAIISGLFHNIGKLAVDKELLLKADTLTPEEFTIVKSYPLAASNYINKFSFITDNIKKAIRQHHERRDGSGYPLGLKGKEINRFAHIVAVADEYDAAISEKCYKNAVSPLLVSEELFEHSLDGIDPEASQTLIRFLQKNYVGLKVKLSTGEVGNIVFANKLLPNRPLIEINKEKFYDLSEHFDIKITDVLN